MRKTMIFFATLVLACGEVTPKDKDSGSASPDLTDGDGGPGPDDTGATPAPDTGQSGSETGTADTGLDDTGEPEPDTADLDGDGYSAADGDCNDLDSSRHPGRDEVCDGVDNNCNDEIDEGVVPTWYLDYDSDGFGGSSFTYEGCEPLEGYVATADDCDDASALVFPGAAEICDELDNDCNGVTDEEVTSTYYLDSDGDGFGDAGFTVAACSLPSGYSNNALDCDDFSAAVSPAGLEVCDGLDNDCSGDVDGSDATDAALYFRDADVDGYGTPDETTRSCMVPAGFVANSLDCDDHDNDIYPDAEERCDGEDNDCDGVTDEDGYTLFADMDGDGYGDPDTMLVTCEMVTGYTTMADDCDDSDPDINPMAEERCDAIDNDCDGEADEDGAVDALTFYADIDGDGYGDGADTVAACTEPDGFSSESGDCDLDDPSIHPGAEEVSDDGIDQDCDGEDLVVPTHTGSEPGWFHANYSDEYLPFDRSRGYNGTINCTNTCAAYGLEARGARFVCNVHYAIPFGSTEGCHPENEGMYGEANCGMMVRDFSLLTENGNTEDCAGGIMACVTGSCSESVTYHSVECQCE